MRRRGGGGGIGGWKEEMGQVRVNFNDDLQDTVVEKSFYEAFPTSLVPRHPPLSGRSVPGYSALLFSRWRTAKLARRRGVYQDKGNRAADRAD